MTVAHRALLQNVSCFQRIMLDSWYFPPVLLEVQLQYSVTSTTGAEHSSAWLRNISLPLPERKDSAHDFRCCKWPRTEALISGSERLREARKTLVFLWVTIHQSLYSDQGDVSGNSYYHHLDLEQSHTNPQLSSYGVEVGGAYHHLFIGPNFLGFGIWFFPFAPLEA